MKLANKEFEIKIAITPLQEEGPSVSIHWENAPDFAHEWDVTDQIWTKMCDSIHGFLANIGPSPEQGYKVSFSCNAFDHLIEPITRQEYHERNKASNSNA